MSMAGLVCSRRLMETHDTPAGGPTVLDSAPADSLPEASEPPGSPPPVVAVVVTKNPGEWFEATLAGLRDQDYPDLTVLVIDAGSDSDPTSRVAAVLPHAFVRRTDASGFAAAANVALETVQGATFLLFLHDDVALDAFCTRLLVEEAFRSNAAALGPKLVRWDNPEILLEVGLAIDRFGVPFSGIEPGELDQEQHDGVRDVFYVSSTAMLVRADLFVELGGFDAEAFPGAEDLDLCWRTRLAGGRVLVVPDAWAAHRQTTEGQPRAERSGVVAADSTRVRTVLKSYSSATLLWTVPLGVLVAALEAIGLLITGRRKRARSILGAWIGNLAHPARWRAARRPVQRARTVRDRELRYLQIRGSARAALYFSRRLHTEDRLHTMSVAGREFMGTTARRARRPLAVGGILLAVAYLVGSRGFISGHVPEVGSFLHWPGFRDAWSTFGSGWRYSGVGHALPASPVFVLLGTTTLAFLGHVSFAQTVVVLAAVPVGAFGVYRCARSLSPSSVPAAAAAFAYATNPVARNMLGTGRFGPLVFFALAPFIVSALWRASGTAFGHGDVSPRRPRARPVLALAVLVAISAAVFPTTILFVVGIALSMLLSVPLVRGARFAGRTIAVAAIASGVALLLLLPWPFSLFGSGGRTALGWVFPAHWGLADVLRFHTGPAGEGVTGFALLAAAAVVLLIGNGPRFAWGVRVWLIALAGFGFVWVPSRWWPDIAMPAPEAALVVAALGLALAIGLGVGVFVDDVRRARFGWRQFAAVAAVVALVVPAVGFLADIGSGRWGAPGSDWASALRFMSTQRDEGAFRVLWVGDPSVLPGDPAIRPTGIGFGMTRDGSGDARDLWPAPTRGGDRLVAESIDLVASARTNRIGHLLAPMGVRYIAVTSRRGPGDANPVAIPGLGPAFAGQLDLTRLDVHDEGLQLYENQSWAPIAAAVAGDATRTIPVDSSDPKRAALLAELSGATAVALPGTTAKPLPAGALLWSESFDTRWRASASATPLVHRRAFGWSNAYRVPRAARVSLSFRGQTARTIVVVVDLVAWIAVVCFLVATRRRRDRSRAARRAQRVTRGELASEPAQ